MPFQAGSGTDTIARMIADGLAQAFGQQVVVENRPGAAGNIGAEIGAKSPADGYTLFMVSMTHVANVTLYPKRAYDLMRDFAPVTQLGTGPEMVVVHPSMPVKSVPELVKLAQAKPAAINFASGGVGTAAFLGMALNNPAISKRLAELGYVSVGNQPEEFAAYIRAEIERLAKVLQTLPLSAD